MFAMIAAMTLINTDAQNYAKTNGWSIDRNNGSCTMGSLFEDGNRSSMFVVFYDYRQSTVTLVFTDSTIKSLNQGDKRDLKIMLVGKTKLDDGWGQKTFNISKLDSGETMFSTQVDEEMLADLSSNIGISFYYGDAIVQGYKLSGSSDAVAKLRACAFDERKNNPTDPFK